MTHRTLSWAAVLLGTACLYGVQASAQTPVPGRVEAEDYSEYFDTTAGNSGGAYRNDNVDIEVTSDSGGGYNLGWVAASEYLRYPIQVNQSGAYTVTVRSATPYSGKGLRVKVDGADVSGRLEVPNTQGWQNWTDLSFQTELSAGSHTVEVYFEDDLQNLNYLDFSWAGDGNPGGPGGDWDLVWSDEFEQGYIDTGKWEHEVNGWGGGNNELQYYTARPENSYVANGKLIIVARQETYTGPDGTRNYTSARLRTKHKGDWLYGRMEIRARLPYGQGLWPAIWMLPTDDAYGGWAASGEIDIMEAVNLNAGGGNLVHGTLHYGGSWPNNTYSGQSFDPGSSVVSQFHDYAVEWEPGEIRWYVDGVHYQTQTDWWTANGSYPAPFDQRFHMILNVAVGGNWPGSPNGSTSFPQTMEVEYVRVYQK